MYALYSKCCPVVTLELYRMVDVKQQMETFTCRLCDLFVIRDTRCKEKEALFVKRTKPGVMQYLNATVR